jgi:hypothetical protein
MWFSEIDDSKGLCKDVTNLGRWGNGVVEVGLSSAGQLEDVMYLVAQSFEKNVENGGAVRVMIEGIKLKGLVARTGRMQETSHC